MKRLESELTSLGADKSAVDESVEKLSAEIAHISAELEETRAFLSNEQGLRETVQAEVKMELEILGAE